MSFVELAQVILGFLAIVAVGWLLRRTGVLSSADAQPIHNIIIYAGLPALIFSVVHPAKLDQGLAGVALVAWGVFAVTALLAWAVCRFLHLSRPMTGGFVLAAALGNTGYIGYPVSLAFFGDEGLVRAIFYDVFGTVGALLLIGLFIAQRFGSAEEGRINPLKEALAFPAIGALFVALLLRSVEIPAVVSGGLDALASLVVPLIMISVGLSLRPRTLVKHAVPLAFLGGIRLVLAPLTALVLASLSLSDAEAVRLVVLEAGMPSMMLTLVIGARFRLDLDFIASAIFVTTVASVVTIPLMQMIAAG